MYRNKTSEGGQEGRSTVGYLPNVYKFWVLALDALSFTEEKSGGWERGVEYT